ncbi:MAG: gliding motility-associated C-terminal domain-containing protein [Bacteroidia bacterium]|nr:gliding motility-associated C-terminal domain-containing protein [Bacteroidia bacterium]
MSRAILFMLAIAQGLAAWAQICNASGNVLVYSNYEGGFLTVSIDQNIPNLKIGICTYEAVSVSITGPFAANVTEVIYAGFNGPNNSACGPLIPQTLISGVPASIVTIYGDTPDNYAIASYLGEPVLPGFPPLVNCMVGAEGTCSTSNSGGGNSAPQIVQFFLQEFGPGSVLRYHWTDYSCFPGPLSMSAGGNCCLEAPSTPPNPIYTGGSSYSFLPDSADLCGGPLTLDLSFYPVLIQPPVYPGYVWSDGTTGPQITITQPGTYSFTVGDYCHVPGVNELLTDTIIVTACCTPPPAPLLSPSAVYCEGQPLAPLAAVPSAGGVITWYGDAALSTVLAAGDTLIPLAAAGSATYFATETAGGCESPAAQVTVTVQPAPAADAGPPQEYCPGGSGAQLNASGGISYNWSPAQLMLVSDIPAPLVFPSVTTLFTVTVTDANGCSATDTVTVRVRDDYVADAGPDQTVCAGVQVQLGAASTIPGAVFSWSPAAGLSNPAAAAPLWAAGSTTVFAVIAQNAQGCSAADSVRITVLPAPAADAGPDTAVCLGTALRLQGSGGQFYTWSPAAGLSDPSVPDPLASLTASRQLVLAVRDAAGCEDRDSVQITVLPLPRITAVPAYSICEGDSIRMQAAGGLSYRWEPADDLLGADQADPLAFPAVTTAYVVTGTDANGCSAAAAALLTVNPAPKTRITGDSIGCAGTPFVLTASGGNSYRWSTGETSTQITVDASGPLEITATAFLGQCEGRPDTIRLRPVQPQALFSFAPDSGYAPVFVQTDNQSTGAESYLWIYENNRRSEAFSPELTFPAPGEYLITLIARAGSCSDTLSQQIRILLPGIFVPSGFSPNGDQSNDAFFLAVSGLSQFRFSVYNRWGERVYTTEDPAFRWDGTWQGRACPEGVYLYVLEGAGANGRSYRKEGTITLIR